jgi:DNA-binding transcriptional regulator YdaS (Cro superfamily)
MSSFSDIFASIGGPARLAEAIGIKPFHAQTMKTRDSIPPEYWPAIVSAAKKLGIEGITADALMDIAAKTAARRKERAAEGSEVA